MEVHCLLDANSVIKYYVNLPGSNVVKHLFDKSPNAIINISNVQIAEVVSLLYKFQREGVISSENEREEFKDTFFNDIKIGKIIRYAFVDEHILDFDVYEKITITPPPSKIPIIKILDRFGGFIRELKDIADTGDAIMLMIMREINLLTDGNAYLVTCDGHVLEVAKALKLNTINPERIRTNNLPLVLDGRKHKRVKIPILKVICTDFITKEPLGSTSTFDVSEGGISVRKRLNLSIGRLVELKLSPMNEENPLIECCGEVIRSNDCANAIKFSDLIPNDQYHSIVSN